jgi:hypothetical protein
MKVTVRTDCTPEEVRRFLGLPDLKPMQDAVMAEIERRTRDAVPGPGTLAPTWLPFASHSFEWAQRAMDFWAAPCWPAPGRWSRTAADG